MWTRQDYDAQQAMIREVSEANLASRGFKTSARTETLWAIVGHLFGSTSWEHIDQEKTVPLKFFRLGAPTWENVILIPQTPAPRCTPEQDVYNRSKIPAINHKAVLARRVGDYARTLNEQSNELLTLAKLRREHNDFNADTSHWVCLQSGNEVIDAYNGWVNAFNNAVDGLQIGVSRVFDNAYREVDTLKRCKAEVLRERDVFENSRSGGQGVKGINDAHAKFLAQEAVCSAFALESYDINHKAYDADAYYDALKKVASEEAQVSAVTELDRLRDEYVYKSIDVPSPVDFTRTASSKRFTFAQLNTGSYSWAILKPVLLAALDGIADEMNAAKYKIQLNSVYRNPARSSGKSQHQYGYAVDIQVFDFNGSGGSVDEKDWNLLKIITDRFHPSYTEPVAESGPGHVHVDWRQQSYLLIGGGELPECLA
ncbi:hypothetical protein PQR46_32330 [Paraburkholderia sediminicola]|uniref:hypothetical protein n=1 Tax=Paraburkholderia sediminicola TaxID=458836 RepID=UPI0038BB8147